jgi:hypothetical protein
VPRGTARAESVDKRSSTGATSCSSRRRQSRARRHQRLPAHLLARPADRRDGTRERLLGRGSRRTATASTRRSRLMAGTWRSSHREQPRRLDTNGSGRLRARSCGEGTTTRVSVSTATPGRKQRPKPECGHLRRRPVRRVRLECDRLVFGRHEHRERRLRARLGKHDHAGQPQERRRRSGHGMEAAASRRSRLTAATSRSSRRPRTSSTGDTNGQDRTSTCAIVRGNTTRVSVTGTSTQGNNDSQNPAISGNGLVVAFETYATNLGGSNPECTSRCHRARRGHQHDAGERSSSGSSATPLASGLRSRTRPVRRIRLIVHQSRGG